MAVIPVEKVHIIVHKSIKDTFLHDLQREGIVHISELKESSPRSSEELSRINDALSQLSGYKKRGILETFVKIKKPINFDTFEKSVRSYDHAKTVAELESVKKEREEGVAEIRHLNEEITLLSPWAPFHYDLSILNSFEKTEALPCVISSKEAVDKLVNKITDIVYSYEIVNTVGSTLYCLFFVKKEQGTILRSILIENECEPVDFRDISGRPAELVASLNQKIAETQRRIDELQERETELSLEISRLEIASDLIANQHKKDEVAEMLPETIRTVNIIGWVKRRDLKRLDALVKEAALCVYDKIEPEPNERPPVALTNSKWSQPYEMLIKLYSMPNPKEYDPTPFLAIFFPLFFALCLTDALYGIILIFFSLYLLRRVSGDRSLIWILFAGGIVTIFTGSIAGGWAGNLFDLIAFEPLVKFKHSLMLFDPLINPLIFLAISLGIGFIHMLLGIGIEVVDLFKHGDYGSAVFANLTWLIFLPCMILYFTVFKTDVTAKTILELLLWACIVGIIVFSHQEGKANLFDHTIWALIIWILWVFSTQAILKMLFQFRYTLQLPSQLFYIVFPLVIVEIVRFKEGKKVLGKIAWGFYNLYGISTYLSVVLSYVRLMALGMVTGVIAMAINIIAWMLLDIPIIGIILIIPVLIGGHLFNLIINCLGGFIHTMRLQYIEFFGRFYAGGSRPFKPFGFETKYVEIE